MGCSHGKINGNSVYDQKERVGIYVDAWEQHQHDIEVFDNVSHGNQSGFAVASESGGLIERIRVITTLHTTTPPPDSGWSDGTGLPLIP
jgi:hypothetical protein